MHFALWEHQHFDSVAVQSVVCIVGGNLYVFAAFFFGYHVGFAALLHVDGANHVVLRHQIVVDALWIYLVLALVRVLHEVLLLGEFLHGAYHLLPFGFAAGAYARADLLVVVGVEGIVGKDFEYLLG